MHSKKLDYYIGTRNRLFSIQGKFYIYVLVRILFDKMNENQSEQQTAFGSLSTVIIKEILNSSPVCGSSRQAGLLIVILVISVDSPLRNPSIFHAQLSYKQPSRIRSEIDFGCMQDFAFVCVTPEITVISIPRHSSFNMSFHVRDNRVKWFADLLRRCFDVDRIKDLHNQSLGLVSLSVIHLYFDVLLESLRNNFIISLHFPACYFIWTGI